MHIHQPSAEREVVAECGELTLFRDEFEALRRLIRARAGIHLPDNKSTLVASRLARRLRALGIASYGAYAELLRDGEATDECERFINALTTNKTSFYREAPHFEVLRDALLVPRYRAAGADARVRIWCAASSTGEEPYTIALTALEAAGVATPGRVPSGTRILATDLDTTVLAVAERGVYSEEVVGEVPRALTARYFVPGVGTESGQVRIRREVRDLLTFRQLNLIAPRWPMRGPFDAIFCRNVLIYFDAATQLEVVRRLGALLAADGHLFLGHSESMVGTRAGLESVGGCVFRTPGARGTRSAA